MGGISVLSGSEDRRGFFKALPSALWAEHSPALQPHLVQLGLERVYRALELVGGGHGRRDEGVTVRVES